MWRQNVHIKKLKLPSKRNRKKCLKIKNRSCGFYWKNAVLYFNDQLFWFLEQHTQDFEAAVSGAIRVKGLKPPRPTHLENFTFKGGESSSQLRWFIIAKIKLQFLIFFVLILRLRLLRYSTNTKRYPLKKVFENSWVLFFLPKPQ